MSYQRWSAAEDEWIINNAAQHRGYGQIADAFNRNFGSERSIESLKNRIVHVLKIKIGRMVGKPYSEQEQRYILENHKNLTLAEISDGLKKLTGRRLSKSAVGHYMSDILNVNRMGRNSVLRKGERIGKVDPIGSEYVNIDGYTLVKVSDTGIKNADWKTKQSVEWERIHSTPPNGIVVFLNGDKTDYGENNLYCVNRKIHGVMCLNKWYTSSREHTLVAIKWCELHYALKNID